MHKLRDIRTAKNYIQTVLLLDDQEVSLMIHRALINKINPRIKVVSFKEPIEALEWLGSKRADLIITDYLMEGMNGVQFIQAARLTKFGQDIPFIVVTARNDQKVHEQLKKTGAWRTFTKPPNLHELSETCRQMLDDSKNGFKKNRTIISS
jgi:two-component system, response regulator RpfG